MVRRPMACVVRPPAVGSGVLSRGLSSRPALAARGLLPSGGYWEAYEAGSFSAAWGGVARALLVSVSASGRLRLLRFVPGDGWFLDGPARVPVPSFLAAFRAGDLAPEDVLPLSSALSDGDAVLSLLEVMGS